MATPRFSAPWFMFDNSAKTVEQATFLTNPIEIIRADKIDEVLGAIKRLSKALDEGLHAAGFFSYELGYALEPTLHKLMPDHRQVPLLWFALSGSLESKKGPELAEYFEKKQLALEPGSIDNVRLEWTKKDYLQRFKRVKELIAAGDIYQANLAFKLYFEHTGDPFSLYTKLRRRQPVSYGSFLQANDFAVLSFSPELFFEARNGRIHSRPMKGTIKRGATQKEDQALFRELQSDPKNCAENLMIVDLMRNDFSRICKLGSVEASDLYRVTPYPTLYQMTSDVQGQLPADAQLIDIIKALMPAGSITGAPKIRAQQTISELENRPRGLYCGAMGLLSRDVECGHLNALFNVAIRTLTLFSDGRGEAGIGSGVVQDSQGPDEYQECLLKAKFMTMPDFKLIETMRLDPDGSIFLLERHLSRLQHSCRTLGFLCPLEEIRESLTRQAKSLERGTYRVRLVLDIEGRFDITTVLIEGPDPRRTITFLISDHRVDSKDALLAHKTTRRQLFDTEWALANSSVGAKEVLFLNERGELTEGARSNLFIERDGKLVTPPLACGLLPGTLREQLKEEGRVVEAVLKPEELEGAKIYFGNSVRGLQPAKLVKG